MKKNKYFAKITYKMDDTHPDFIEEYRDKIMTYEDIYKFDAQRDPEDAEYAAKEDMMLVAGGGYDWNHIKVLDFIFYECDDKTEKEFRELVNLRLEAQQAVSDIEKAEKEERKRYAA